MAKKRGRAKAREFVLDCSLTMAWYFRDESNAYAKAVRKGLTASTAVVPGLWPLEVANVLVLAERRQRSTAADAAKWLSFLRLLPIRIDAETAARAWSDTLPLARSHGLSVYDAAYLELAVRLCWF